MFRKTTKKKKNSGGNGLIIWVVLQSMVSDIAAGLACKLAARAARYTLMLSNACAKVSRFPAVRSFRSPMASGYHVEQFQNYLNSKQQCIQFTSETETNNRLNFLDVTITKLGSSFSTSM